MLTTIIERVIRFRAVVLLFAAAGFLLSAYVVRTAALDAIPDISDPQIIVYAKWARSPELIEAEITEPLIRTLVGSPDVESIRGTSHLGYAFIYVILSDSSRREAVEDMVRDQVDALRPQLPPDAVVTLGPNASSLGWIYQYAIVDEELSWDLRDLRLLNENSVKTMLERVPGVAEVASVGGLEKQYQLKIFPPLLANAGVTLRQVITALQDVFQQVGGRTIEVTNRDYQLRGVIDGADIDKLELLIVGRALDGRPVQLRDIGHIQIGYDLRRGIADLDGNGEVVGGIVIMEQGQNVLAVTRSLEQRLEQVNTSLPEGLEIVSTYNRSSLIWETLTNFSTALAYELLVVTLVIVWALRNGRAAVAPVCVLILGTLFTVLPMSALGQTINLLSLAGSGDRHRGNGRCDDRHRRKLYGGVGETGRPQPRGHAPDDHPRDRPDDPAAVVLDADHRRLVPARLLPWQSARGDCSIRWPSARRSRWRSPLCSRSSCCRSSSSGSSRTRRRR